VEQARVSLVSDERKRGNKMNKKEEGLEKAVAAENADSRRHEWKRWM
jgi:hypothetical protein